MLSLSQNTTVQDFFMVSELAMVNLAQNNPSYSFVTLVKLDQHNFILWRTQVLASIKGSGMEDFINGDRACLEQLLPHKSIDEAGSLVKNGSRSTNPEFTA